MMLNKFAMLHGKPNPLVSVSHPLHLPPQFTPSQNIIVYSSVSDLPIYNHQIYLCLYIYLFACL